MGIGTLIVFIAFILIAAVAALVLLSNMSDVRNKALKTSKATVDEVGTSLTNVQLYAEDGTDAKVDYIYYSIKLSSGSEPLRFADSVMTFNLNNISQEYSYADESVVNCSRKDATDPTSIYNETTTGKFGLQYILKSGRYTPGYLFPGSMVVLCYKTPRTIREQEKFESKIILKVGATLLLQTETPALMTHSRVYIFP
jgi:archaellin